MTTERLELVRYYINIGLGLPEAVKKVKKMSDEEVQTKREKIAASTFFKRIR